MSKTHRSSTEFPSSSKRSQTITENMAKKRQSRRGAQKKSHLRMQKMTPSEYEQLTRNIMRSLLERVNTLTEDSVGCGRSNHHCGASSYPHQIDVSLQVGTEFHV